MLLTRSPLSPVPKDRFSLDLHVLSAPPAFVLSQDQTLREDGMPAKKLPAILSLRASYLLKGRFRRIRRSSFIDEVETLSPEQAEARPRSRFSTSKNVRC